MIDFLGSVMPEEVFMNRACLHEATVADEEKPWPRRSVGLKAGVMHLNTRGAPVHDAKIEPNERPEDPRVNELPAHRET